MGSHIPRCFVDPARWRNAEAELSAEEAHHLANVLRAVIGDSVIIFDGRGREALGELTALRDGSAIVTVLELTTSDEAYLPELTLIQAIPKHKSMDLIVQKATELGVAHIIPVVTRHTVVRFDEAKRKARRSRWEQIAVNASKQCGSSRVPAIGAIVDYDEALSIAASRDLFLFGTLQPGAQSFGAALRQAKLDRPASVGFLIGPEGDLSDRELSAATEVGGKGVSLGRLVLRVETAAIYVISILNYELQDSPLP